ncbi:MAG TPA: DNA-3-methyladenine glycosylase [Syntrophorhabdales bacterium]|nr:DNA-3-methyladenine glycosylase [Syntrophorhabdales bacterium]
MRIFIYGQAEIDHLKRRDKKLGAAIEMIGIIRREIRPDPFEALVMSVVAQQISNKAADAIRARLYATVKHITPESIAKVDFSRIQKCGLSARKTEYIKGIAHAALRGDIDFSRLDEMKDDEIIRQLSSLRGIGIWTAEMLLLFSLCRPDVVSWTDQAIRRGMMNLYGLKDLTKEQFQRYRKRYSPYGSVASLYLWALSVR